MLAHLLTVLGYIAATVLVQGLSHFKFNKAHYDATGFYRQPPIAMLGVASMIVQALILSISYDLYFPDNALGSALGLCWAFGAFLASYMALALAGELKVPSVTKWIVVEGSAAVVQFTLAGLALWGAYHFA